MLSLADAILQEDIDTVRQSLRYSNEINVIDEYGFTPLIEAAIVDNVDIARLLLERGADPNLQDVTGGTALHWATENSNLVLCKLLLEHQANPNAYNTAGQPVLVMPILRRQKVLRQLLIRYGADEAFAQDYVNSKLLGHLFELVGTVDLIDPKNNYVEMDFEGFYLEVTLGLVSFSLDQFQNHYAARQFRRYQGISNLIVDVIGRAAQLIKYQQYRIDISKYENKIDALLKQSPVLIPVGYEGHAITFINSNNIWVKCDRREDSRLYDNIMIYRVTNTSRLTTDLFKKMIYEKQTSQFINEELDKLLGLQPITEVKVEAQISGNCSWANVEAAIPAIFFLALMQVNTSSDAVASAKSQALNFFHRWREWNKDRALDTCIQRFKESDFARKACQAEILAAILFQRCDMSNAADRNRINKIMAVFIGSSYLYILKNYLRVYYYESATPDGKRFAELLKQYGVTV